ncbi:helicase HerA domain-containing protein [Paludisphaera borealis]|uniref:Helicase HerA central domain-containing protein n=1 Tax=Paludisphaera borealis TaxID=1387353 RepID=A0A1U7CYY3_9BACT|nr:DUF87 domain-containing protein [Paludisphaera borealis]APW64172.1 hypothetical protein BSF38_05764 [Paludisphaera borealis]
MKNEDFEQLGFFYLGKYYDQERRAVSQRTFLYDSKQLTTHAVCVGMTGSGKTGLCISLLEEAAIDGIPVIAIDPKGDVGDLLLGFPDLRGSDFLPWIDADAAARQGESREQFADQTAETWRKGLADWGQDGARIKRLQDAADLAIYTPGSSAGLPLTVLRSFNAPPPSLVNDAEAYRDRVASAVSGLLALLGIDADPIASREHILLSNLLDQTWRNGRDLDLPGLIHAVQAPPFDKVGVIDLETFYPAKERFTLALKMNNLIASPGFAGWMEGESLDVPSLLYTAEGKPRISIMSIAHLNDSERMFFVTILLNEILAWVRTQPGTSSLRAVLYMDEIFGYFPPTANPPSKKPMLTLLKQGRAFGLGVVLATQNPVDLDYKGLSNAGAWFLGRLQTQRDKDRVLEGLEGASNAAGASFNRKQMDETLSALGKRVFVMNNVHEDHPVVFETRWALSYLAGPLTREQIQKLMAPRKQALAAKPASPAVPAADSPEPEPAPASEPKPSPAPGSPSAAVASGRRPVVPPDVPEFFLPRVGVSNPGSSLEYRPALLGVARLHYVEKKAGVDYWETLALLRPIADEAPADVWEEGKQFTDQIPELDKTPETGASFAALPAPLTRAKSYPEWTKTLKNHLYRARKLTIWTCPELKAYGKPEETARDFRMRLTQGAREKRDADIEALRAEFGPRRTSLEKRMRQAQERLEAEQAQASKSTWDAAVSLGTSMLDAFTGRKTWTKTNVSKAGAAAKAAGRAMQKRGEAGSAQAQVDKLNEEYVDLETEFQADLELIKATRSADLLKIVPLELTPRKADITVERVVLAWTPWNADAGEPAEIAYQSS